jgi:hypothetical protein
VRDARDDPSYSIGELVLCSHQDRFVISNAFVQLVPAVTPAEVAAFANLFNVALNCHLDVPVCFGDCYVVFGLGIIGTFAAHLANRCRRRPNFAQCIVAGDLMFVADQSRLRDQSKGVFRPSRT